MGLAPPKVQNSFLLRVGHVPLSPAQMFAISEHFDFSEIGASRNRLTVDVEDVTTTETTLHITPTTPLEYGEIAAEVEVLLRNAANALHIQLPLLLQIDWILDRHGVRSDSRAGLGKIS